MVRTQLDADMRAAVERALDGAPPLSPQYRRYVDTAISNVTEAVNTFLDEVVEDLTVSAIQMGATPDQAAAALDMLLHDGGEFDEDEVAPDLPPALAEELASLRARVENLESIARSARLM